MNPLLRFLIGVKGFHVRGVGGQEDVAGPDDMDEERPIKRGVYEQDRDFMRSEAERREHDNLIGAKEINPRRPKVITTSDQAEGPTIHSIDETAPEPSPEKLSLREKWRRLREEVDKRERK